LSRISSADSRPEPVLAVIPARAGSKGIPGKNTRLLAGKPLVAHAIEFALSAGVFDRALLTTDSLEIAAVGRSFGAETPFLRPAELATDDTPMLAVLEHAVRAVSDGDWKPETIVLLQPTAPFRRKADLLAALALFQGSPEADSVVSVELVPSHYSPHFLMKVVDNRLLPFLPEGSRIFRRQDALAAYSRNGQFYLMRRRTLEQHSLYGTHSVPFVTSHPAVNLDSREDWEAAECLAAKIGLPPP
jgi:CMP-N-acetylneuraminic acid synthetase